MSDRVLVVAAHPDDEVLGCGGVMAKHADAGDEVHVLFIADGVTSRTSGGSDSLNARNQAASAACRILGSHPPVHLAMPDNALDSVPLLEIVQRIELVLTELVPSCIYTHSGGDLNIDHQYVQKAVLTAARPLPNSSVRAIYAFEVLSSTGWAAGDSSFRPNRFVEITPYLDRKLDALRCYDAEMRDFPHARSYRSVEALARYRGAAVGFHAAEAFDVLRELA